MNWHLFFSQNIHCNLFSSEFHIYLFESSSDLMTFSRKSCHISRTLNINVTVCCSSFTPTISKMLRLILTLVGKGSGLTVEVLKNIEKWFIFKIPQVCFRVSTLKVRNIWRIFDSKLELDIKQWIVLEKNQKKIQLE